MAVPYIFQSLNRARKEIILKKNPLAFHWRDADPQAPAKIVIKELSDRLPKLISGEVDLVPEIGATALFRTELQNEFQILYSPASSFYYIGFNNNEDSQTMQRLLRGMAKTTGGLDWFAILKRAYEGIDQETKHFIRNNNFNKDAEVLTGPFDSSSPVELAYDEASEQAEEQWTQTIKTQQELVAGNCLQSASGNKGLLADPIVLKTLGMKKWTIIYQDFSKFSPELKDIADGFAARLQQLGATPNQIEVNGVRSLNQWQYKIHNRLFDCVVAHFDYGQDYDIADFIMPQGTQNYVGFYSRQVVRHFEEFQKTQDPGRRVFCLTQIHKLLREQFPGIFVIAPVKFTVYNQRKIRRLYTDDNFFFARMQHWQMHTEKKTALMKAIWTILLALSLLPPLAALPEYGSADFDKLLATEMAMVQQVSSTLPKRYWEKFQPGLVQPLPVKRACQDYAWRLYCHLTSNRQRLANVDPIAALKELLRQQPLEKSLGRLSSAVIKLNQKRSSQSCFFMTPCLSCFYNYHPQCFELGIMMGCLARLAGCREATVATVAYPNSLATHVVTMVNLSPPNALQKLVHSRHQLPGEN